MSRLIACTSCHRHARTSETKCPFCSAPMPAKAPVRGRPAGTFGRAAIVIATTTGAAAIDLSGCSDGPNIVDVDSYGMPPDVVVDHVILGDAYGIPFDSGKPDVDAMDAGDATADATDAATDTQSD